MGTKTNRMLYIIEILLITALICAVYFVAGNVTIVTLGLITFSLFMNVIYFKKEVRNIVPHWALIGTIILNLAGVWFQYTLYGANPEDAPMNYYLLADALTGFVSIFVAYMAITLFVKKGVKEMSFGSMEHYYVYVGEFNVLIATYLMVTLFTTIQLTLSYTTIRNYLLLYAPNIDSFSTRYLQYFIFVAVPCLVAIGHRELFKDLKKEVQKELEEKYKDEDSI